MRIWIAETNGKARFAEAEQDRQIRVREAQAKLDAAKFESESEIERARGVAEANKIIGESLKNNEAYLRYLWVQGLNDNSGEVIYVPTEANLPILEAGKRKQGGE
jgi:regulator of protease activity HflC (stomatin/prohibitin superfamily)